MERNEVIINYRVSRVVFLFSFFLLRSFSMFGVTCNMFGECTRSFGTVFTHLSWKLTSHLMQVNVRLGLVKSE